MRLMTFEEFMIDLRLAEIERRLDAIEEAFREDTVAIVESEGGEGGAFSGVYWFKNEGPYQLSGESKEYWYHDIQTNVGAWTDNAPTSPIPSYRYYRKTSACREVEYILC